MRRYIAVGVAVLALSAASVAPVEAACTSIGGKFTEHILPQASAPNDPAGRILGTVDGSLEGATTAFITSISPELNGGVHVTTYDTFATLEGNQVFAVGDGHWVLIKTGFYKVSLTLTIVGGTGKYSTVGGTIYIQGVGDNVGPGSGTFLQAYTGGICTP
jgi:hypothetical protein